MTNSTQGRFKVGDWISNSGWGDQSYQITEISGSRVTIEYMGIPYDYGLSKNNFIKVDKVEETIKELEKKIQEATDQVVKLRKELELKKKKEGFFLIKSKNTDVYGFLTINKTHGVALNILRDKVVKEDSNYYIQEHDYYIVREITYQELVNALVVT